MKVKLLETVQGVGISGVLLKTGSKVNILEPDNLYEVGNILGTWLIDNRKAEEVKDAPHYGGQQKAELRHDEEKYEAMTAENEAKESVDEPIMTTENQATAKRSKRGKK